MRLASVTTFVLATIVALGTALDCQAQTFDESISGDFSNDSSAPTDLGLLPVGTSAIFGITGNNDRDIITFTIDEGSILSSFIITEFSQGGFHFFGLAEGDTAPGDGGLFLFSGLITSTQNPIGAPFDAPFEVLGTAGGQLDGQGVPTTLGPGDYTAFFNEIEDVGPNYSAELTVVSSVPEPSSAMLLIGCSGLLLLRRRAR